MAVGKPSCDRCERGDDLIDCALSPHEEINAIPCLLQSDHVVRPFAYKRMHSKEGPSRSNARDGQKRKALRLTSLDHFVHLETLKHLHLVESGLPEDQVHLVALQSVSFDSCVLCAHPRFVMSIE